MRGGKSIVTKLSNLLVREKVQRKTKKVGGERRDQRGEGEEGGREEEERGNPVNCGNVLLQKLLLYYTTLNPA